MPKPVFNPVQYELRNELPTVVSAEQLAQITQATDRVNVQLNWVAQLLGWSGPNYWTNLASTVSEKRALLGGSYGVYDGYTLLRLREIRTWEPSLVTEKKPNIAIGQRVIIGDQQTYIYDLTIGEDHLELNIGEIPEAIISLLEQGAAIKVDCKENRPFPFYRPEPLASGDSDFRCSTGVLTRTSQFYDFYELILSPFSQEGVTLNYTNLQLYGGSYYYFDRAVYLSLTENNYTPWVESAWIQSKGLWQLYIPTEVVGNTLSLVWGYATPGKRAIATKSVQIIPWTDPSDWGEGGQGFNPVLDTYFIEKSYNVAGLNFSLGTFLHLGDNPPRRDNPLWFDQGVNVLYSNFNDQWIQTGTGVAYLSLQDESAPPPYTYDIQPGTIWQSPTGRVFVWDAGRTLPDFFYFFPNAFKDGFIYIDPSLQSVEGFYIFDSDSFFIHNPNGVLGEGLPFINCLPDDDGFYISTPNVTQPDWYEIGFFDQSLLTSVFSPTYASYLSVNVDGVAVPEVFETDDYRLEWSVSGEFLYITYRALTDQGEAYIPNITVSSDFQANNQVIDVSDDFVPLSEEITSVPYNERGPLNNFRGVWGNKGGARPLDFVFDALSIHGFDEREALFLEPLSTLIDYDWMLSEVTGKKCFISDQPPVGKKIGDYYWNNETGTFSVLYMDRDRNEIWVEVDYPTSVCEVGNTECDYFPLKPILSTGSCVTDNGDLWQDPGTPAVAMFFESPNGVDTWVETNWDSSIIFDMGWPFSQKADPDPDFTSVVIYIGADFQTVSADIEYETVDYRFSYSIESLNCAYRFTYIALTELGVQSFPQIWVGPADLTFPPVNITDRVFSEARFYFAPAVQNASSSLRPWKTRSLEVANERTVDEEIYANPLRADLNLGPGDENWDRSFVRLPSEYGRGDSVWSKTRLAVEDFTYAGTDGSLKEMRCPSYVQTPQIYEEVIFYKKDPSVGTLLYSEPYLFSDVEGFFNLSEYFNEPTSELGEYRLADFNFMADDKYDEWTEAGLEEYEPLHYRLTQTSGDWEGVYVEPTGNRPLSGFLNNDLRVRSAITVSAPVWDASIYKYAPLCPQPPETYAEDPNNCKVTYAYFAADLAAAEDGFFDQQKDVSWRQPLTKDQTLYIRN